MKYIKLALTILLSSIWLYILKTGLSIGGNTLPPLGKFFSPTIGFWQNTKSDEFQTTQEFQFPNIKGHIVLDSDCIPHIFADNLNSAYFLQGYIHAKFRLWQMDFSTRAAEGRISEIIGDRALEYDKIRRRKGFAESAKKSIEVWKQFPESYQLIESYSAGVNHYIESITYKNYPIEYKLMDFAPEKWSPYRTALFHKYMADVLCGRDHDVEMTGAKAYFGNDFEMLFPEDGKLLDPVIPSGTKWDITKENLPTNSVYTAPQFGFQKTDPEERISGLGSNNWAVGRSKSLSKNPILCNDPHLSLTLPSIWFEQHIITPDRNVYGVTFPGIAGIVIGFNEHIAWGETNGAWDVLDWYSIQWQDDKKEKYKLDGNWIDVEKRIEKIKIKGGKEILDTVKLTKWGPIVFEGTHPKKDLAMHWIMNEASTSCELDVFVDLNKAKNVAEYRKSIQKFSYPSQNFAFASTNGDIALTVQGNMPLKKNQQGRFIQDGTQSQNAWLGILPLDKVPFTLNPTRGFISSANQKSTDATFPNYYNDGDFRDYRGTVLNDYLSKENEWTVEKMKQLQLNNFSLKAKTALDAVFTIFDSAMIQNSKYSKILQQFKSWNFMYDSTAIEPVLFDLWFDYFYRLTWDELVEDSTKRNVKLPSDLNTIQLLQEKSQSKYFNLVATPKNEIGKDIIEAALDSLEKNNNALMIGNWGKFKKASIPHMAKIPSFGISFISTSGGADILNAHATTWGPSWRMIVEMTADGPIGQGIYPGGQSGHPGSKYYMNMVEDWRLGKYRNLQFVKSETEIKNPLSTFHFK